MAGAALAAEHDWGGGDESVASGAGLSVLNCRRIAGGARVERIGV